MFGFFILFVVGLFCLLSFVYLPSAKAVSGIAIVFSVVTCAIAVLGFALELFKKLDSIQKMSIVTFLTGLVISVGGIILLFSGHNTFPMDWIVWDGYSLSIFGCIFMFFGFWFNPKRKANVNSRFPNKPGV